MLDGLTAADVTVLRFLVAGLVLLPAAIRRRPFAVGQLGWRRGLTVGLLAGAPYSLVIVGGAAFLPALHSAVVIFGAIPLASTALAYGVFGDRPSGQKIASLLLVVAGLVVFGWHTLSGGAAAAAWPGFALFLVGATMWALFSALSKRWDVPPLQATVTIAMLSLASVPVWIALLPTRLAYASLSAIALQASYMGLLVGVASTYLYTRSVTLLGPVRASMFVALVPPLTALLSAPLLGERPTASEIAGMLAVASGVALSLRRGRSRVSVGGSGERR